MNEEQSPTVECAGCAYEGVTCTLCEIFGEEC